MPDILLIFIETSCSINQRQQTRRHPDEVNKIGRNSYIQHNQHNHHKQHKQHNQPYAMSVADPGEGPGARGRGGGRGGTRASPLFLDQTEVRRAEKIFLRLLPPPFLRVWMTSSPRPLPLSEGLDPPLYVNTDTLPDSFRTDMNDDVNSYGTELHRV